MGMTVVTVATGGMPVVETPGGYPVAEGQMGVPVTKVTGMYGWPVTYTGGSGPPNWSSTIFPGSLQIAGQTIADSYDIHAYLETITANVLPVGGQTMTPVYAPAGTGTTTVTAPNGQTWTFNGTLTNGTYVNGDPWVLDTGSGVSLLSVSTPPTGSGQSARHGGMINPTFNTLVEVHSGNVTNTTAMKQGYDGRIDEVTAYGIQTFAYDATLNAHASLPKTLHAGDSLCSATSLNPSQDFTTFWGIAGSNKTCLERMAVVTVVGTTPAADAFRPNYFGTTKYNFTFSGANTALLPNLTAPFNPKGVTSDDFHLDSSSIYIGGPDEGRSQTDMMNISALRDVWYWVMPLATSNRRMIMPHFNQYWHAAIGRTLGQLAMYCMCNFADRDVFLKRILQAAIDAYAVAVAEGTAYLAPFGNGAGYYPTPLWIIRLAGLLFNHTGMKNAGSLSSNNTDFYGAAVTKWGECNRTYLSPNATAHAQYARVPGADYSAGFPLYGDTPRSDISGAVLGLSSNLTVKDPAGVFDMNDYKYNTPHPSYMSAVPYTLWAPLSGANAGIEQTGPVYTTGDPPPFNAEPYLGAFVGSYLGAYMTSNNNDMMANMLSSIAMGDAAFWPNASVVPFAKRIRFDPKTWEGWGIGFDSSDYSAYIADIRGRGGSGNGWMNAMWDLISPIPAVETITPGSLPITGATLTPVYVPAGGGATTIFSQTLTSNDPGYGGYSIRSTVVITGGAGATSKVRVTFEADSANAMSINNASIGISAAPAGDIADPSFPVCTATPVELTFNTGGHGFAIAAGQTKVSDWVTLGGFTSANFLCVTMDFGGSNANPRVLTGITGQANTVIEVGTNYADVSFTTPIPMASRVMGFNKIEVQ